MTTSAAVTAYLDTLLDVASFDDASNNGLQVANSGRVRRMVCAVDATLDTFEEAARRGADLLVAHHGISWGDSLCRITGLAYRRVAVLVRHDIALYAAHLPLDAHPLYGNNAQIARALGLRNRRPFGTYRGRKIGFSGSLPRPIRFTTLKKRLEKVFGAEVTCAEYGKPTVRTVAVVSGGAGAEAAEAGEKGIDVFITGERQLVGHNLAREYGLHAVFAGHYATETFGVRALAGVLKHRFKIPVEFLDRGVAF